MITLLNELKQNEKSLIRKLPQPIFNIIVKIVVKQELFQNHKNLLIKRNDFYDSTLTNTLVFNSYLELLKPRDKISKEDLLEDLENFKKICPFIMYFDYDLREDIGLRCINMLLDRSVKCNDESGITIEYKYDWCIEVEPSPEELGLFNWMHNLESYLEKKYQNFKIFFSWDDGVFDMRKYFFDITANEIYNL